MPNYVNGIGPLEPDLMAVGEAPGKNEDETGIPFAGVTGGLLNEALEEAGILRSEVYLTNVSKYRPPYNDFSKLHLIGVDLEQCVNELWENEIRRLRPKCILAVGNEALKALTGYDGIMNYRGSILTAKDGVTKVVPTIHPAALFSHAKEGDEDRANGGLEWTWWKIIKADIARAVEESKTRELDLPRRDLSIAHNSLDLYRFFREYEKLEIAACDIESINCIPVCVGFAFTKHHAISVPLLRQLKNNKLTDMGDREMVECWRLIDSQLRKLKLVGHNFKYDDYKLGLAGFESSNVYSDTLIKCRVVFPELPIKKLHVLSSIWTREPYYKEEGKEFRLGKDNISRLLRYNANDCAVELEVDEALERDLIELADNYNVPLVDYYYKYMMRKHKFYLNMENIGFRVDMKRRKELKDKYTEMEGIVHERLVKAVGHEINVKSYPQIFQLLYKEMKFKLLKRDPTSEDAIVRLLSNHAKKPHQKEILTDLLEERRIRDQKSRYINFVPDYDGRCKTVYNISATETCRSSTGILKKPLRPRKSGLSYHTISAHGRLAKDIKSMFIRDENKIFLKADSSQAEARVVAVLAKQWDLLEVIDRICIHRRTSALVLGYTSSLVLTTDYIPVVDDMEKDGPERFCGKKTRHAGNYKMGKGRFMTEFNTDAQKFDIPMNISEWKAGEMIRKFREADSRLEANFWADIEECLKSTRVLIDPFGGVRIFNGRMDDELFKEGYANLPQRTVAHLVQGAALKINDELNNDLEHGVQWLGEKHDELLLQVPENNWKPYAKLLKKHMEAVIDFSIYCSLKRDYKLVIPCDIEISNTHLGAFQKVKIEKEIAA